MKILVPRGWYFLVSCLKGNALLAPRTVHGRNLWEKRTFLKNCHSSNSTCLLAEGLDKHPINRGLVSSYLNTEYGANTCESKSTKFPHNTREAWILSTTVFKLQGDRAPSDRHELESLFVSFAAIWLAAGSEYSRRDNSFISMPGRPAH